MDLTQSRTLDAPRDRVWAALVDPELLKACIPGCESFEQVGENAYRASVAAKIGPVSARFAGRIELADVDPPNGYTLKFEGQGGAAGFANGQAQVALASADAQRTTLSYTVKAQVGGKLAQIGSRLVDGAAAKLADDFFARFAEKVAPPVAAEGAAAVEPAGIAPAAGPARWVRWIALAAIAAIVAWLALKGRSLG